MHLSVLEMVVVVRKFKNLPENWRQVEESELGWAGIMSDIL